MSIPEAVIEASEETGADFLDQQDRARRVIIALAESLPDSAVRAAYLKLVDCLDDNMLTAYSETVDEAIRAAIIAALKDIAGDSP